MESTDAPKGRGKAKAVEPAADVVSEEQNELETALDRLGQVVDASTFNSATLVGDVSASILEMFKHRPKPWDAMIPDEQRDLASTIQTLAQSLVKCAVGIVASAERPSIRAIMDSVSAGDKVKVSLTLSADDEVAMGDAISDLYKCHKKVVLIVLADSDGHNGQARDLVPPDQSEMPFDPGSDGDDD